MSAVNQLGKYQAYPEYKNSGVEWLGEVPSDWVLQRLKFLCHITTGDKDTVEREEEGLYPFFVRSDTVERISTYSFDGEAVLTAGDGAIGKIFHHINGKFDFHQRVYKFSDFKYVNGRYFYHYISNNLANEVIKLSAKTTVDSLRLPMLQNFVFVLPPIEHQVTIAAFLDYETARIDQLIAKQQQLIELLKEKRQAVISHAVTKGLNPNAPMKDSGVEWLGQVPEHWDVLKMKHLLQFVTSGSRGWAEFYSDSGALFFRIANLTRDTIRPKLDSIQNVSPPDNSEGERSRINEGDILISITADLGSVCVADKSIAGGYVSQHVSLSRPKTSILSSDWLAYFVLADTAKEQLLGSGYGGTKVQLSLEDIRDLTVCVPNKYEQTQIADFLNERSKQFEQLINRATSLISYLQERRTALISAAVTGKIDLRGWQPPKCEVAA